MLQTLFYAFLLNFLVIVAINGGVLLFTFTFLRAPLLSQTVLAWVLVSLQVLLGVLVLTGVVYGIARWKDWYDLIDAEY